ncbi:hypothetical protein Tco_0287193 [Tanacetum coccineum]
MEFFLLEKSISYLKNSGGRDIDDQEDDHMDTLPFSENTNKIPVEPESPGVLIELILVLGLKGLTCTNRLCPLNMRLKRCIGDLGEPANLITAMLDPIRKYGKVQ